SSASPAKVPVIWDGQKMWDSFLKDGTGFSSPDGEGKPLALVAFDTQCPDCMTLQKRIKPLEKYIHVIYYPISYLNIHSEPQATTILTSLDPYKIFEQQHEHFKDPDFRGIRYDISKLPESVRSKVWTNTKIHRRVGCRAVPYGVFKTPDGKYLPFDENLTTAELAKLFGIKNYKEE
ncbi:thioredoxin fold domain-containing protein, partial [Turicimonas muris]